MPEGLPKAPFLAPTQPKHFRSSSSMALSRLRAQPQSQVWNASGSRHASNPIVRSPLQQSFPAYPNPGSEEDTTFDQVMQETPSRRSRRSEQGTRPRGESRSSSVPIIVRPLEDAAQSDAGAQLQAGSRPYSRAFSPIPRTRGRANETITNANANPLNPNAKRSVKHLTCFWWWEKGECRFSEEECLYAHHDTGHYTLAPRQVIPGEPAKAGKSLERALNKLAIVNRSSASLSSLATANAYNHGHGHGPAHITTTNNASDANPRPATPHDNGVARSRSNTPSPLEIGQAHAQAQAEATQQLKTDNDFLRSLVQETQREKRALVDTIEVLQNDKNQLQSRIEAMSNERGNLLYERDVLQATIKKLQFANTANTSTASSNNTNTNASTMSLRSPSTGTGGFGLGLSQQSPWGAIGSRRPSPAENRCTGMQQAQRSASDGAADFKNVNMLNNNHPLNNSTNNAGGFMDNHRLRSYTPPGAPALNPAAKPYTSETTADEDDQLDNDLSSFDTGNEFEGENLKSVLRSLGPSF
ncbi:hypothetical protein A1O1_04144 [Capronia coronata CBS 617.96]|uniref:C3H1-type domain-containing protein n=1 Tax=Capronia coronata CBS 617.96 TaxID=1182541 RepID=W9YDT4_9EURO|nr:uncharacterized protein A1O1_04144 [Capronia coronata CBS 617.96]EXJ91037.1 hypothetical protein A1O1_04144 [Capronia coronata CBS 617.96]